MPLLACKKPLTLTIDEGKLICRVAKQTGRVLQVGTQQRSEFGGRFLQAVAMVRDGRIGKPVDVLREKPLPYLRIKPRYRT